MIIEFQKDRNEKIFTQYNNQIEIHEYENYIVVIPLYKNYNYKR